MKNYKLLFLLLIAAFSTMAQTSVPPSEEKGPSSKATNNSSQIWRYEIGQSNKKSSAGFYATVADSMSSVFATDSAGNGYLWNYAGHFGVVDTAVTYSRNPFALMQLISTTKGFMPPAMTTAQQNAIALDSTAAGIMIFNTTDSTINFYNGAVWKTITTN